MDAVKLYLCSCGQIFPEIEADTFGNLVEWAPGCDTFVPEEHKGHKIVVLEPIPETFRCTGPAEAICKKTFFRAVTPSGELVDIKTSRVRLDESPRYELVR